MLLNVRLDLHSHSCNTVLPEYKFCVRVNIVKTNCKGSIGRICHNNCIDFPLKGQ